MAAAGHALGTNSHTSFWNQAEDKFKQIEENGVQGLTDLTVSKEEVRPGLDTRQFISRPSVELSACFLMVRKGVYLIRLIVVSEIVFVVFCVCVCV